MECDVNYISILITYVKKINFETALKDAQKLGYAEADPSFDIGGNANTSQMTDAIASLAKENLRK